MKNVLGIAVLVLITIIILQQKCGKDTVPDVSPYVHKIDSVAAENVALKNKITSDSLDYMDFRRKDDSVHRAMIASKAHIEAVATQKIVALTFDRNKLRTALEGRDTAGAVAICEHFAMLYDSALGLIALYKANADSLEANHTGRTERDSLQITTLYQSINSLQKQVDYLLAEIRELVTQNEGLRTALAKSKKGKKWLAALGFVAGAVISGAVLK